MQWMGDPYSSLIGCGVNASGTPVSATSLGQNNLTLLASTGGGGGMYSCYQTTAMNSETINLGHLNCNGYAPAYNIPLPEMTNQNKPFLTVEEQPVTRIRFRYKSEKGSHGGLTGRNSSLSKTYPTVKLNDYHGNREIRIQASLYTCEPIPRRHVQKLMGRDCNEAGICTVPLREDRTAVFQNLGILFSGKKEVPEILLRRKLETQYGGTSISESDLKKLRDEAEREARDINLNCVKICFEAFIWNPHLNRCETHLCDKIFSDAISNQKSPDSGELKIVKMDRYSGSCTGNEEVFLLCEKVNKKEIKIRFYETNAKGDLLWEGYGSFGEADVHHQVAIVFLTPPYKNTEIENPVTVYVQLFRKKDGECSDPKSFIYTPVVRDEEGIERKRKKILRYHPLQDYPTHLGEYASSPGFLGDSSENSGFGTPMYYEGHSPGHHRNSSYPDEEGLLQSYINQSSPILKDSDPVFSTTNGSLLFPYSSQEERLDFIQKDSSIISAQEGIEKKFLSLKIKDDKTLDLTLKKSDEPYKVALKTGEVVLPDTKCAQQSDLKTVRNVPLEKSTSMNLHGYSTESMKLQCSKNQDGASSKMANLASFDSIRKALCMQSLLSLQHFVITADIIHLLSNMRNLIALQDEDGDNILHMAVIHQPQEHAMISSLLQVAKFDVVNNTNNLKQSPLHLAVLSNSHQLVKILLKYGANPSLQDRKGDTAFHLASKHDYIHCLSELLSKENYNNFPTTNQGVHSMPLHLKRFNLDILNYNGYSALHLAVINGSEQCVHYLCSARADVNALDGTSGRTALHLAVEHNHPHIVTFLLSLHYIEVDSQDFAGNTPLHLACGRNLLHIATQLIHANANPLMESCDKKYLHDMQKEQGKTSCDLASNNKQIEDVSGKKNFISPESKVCDTERTDSGYLSSHISSFDDKTLSKLCQVLDPPSDGWEKLGSYLGLEENQISDIKKLGGSCTASVIKFFEAHVEPECGIQEHFINVFKTADLQDALQVVAEGFNQ